MAREEFDEEIHTYMPFTISKVLYAVSIEYVDFVVAASEKFPKCRLPHEPEFVDSVVFCSGEYITIIDLLQICESTVLEKSHHSLMLMLHYSGKRFGILADHIDYPISFTEKDCKKDEISKQEILVDGDKEYVVFDILKFYKFLFG